MQENSNAKYKVTNIMAVEFNMKENKTRLFFVQERGHTLDF